MKSCGCVKPEESCPQCDVVKAVYMKSKPKKAKIETGLVYAMKKSKRAPTYMPDEVILLLDGEPKGRLLMPCGWTMTTSASDKSCTRWPLARLKSNLGRLEEEWAEDFGKSWKLEIRSTVGA